MQLSVVIVKDVTGEPEGPWQCILENSPIIEEGIRRRKLAWFRGRHFHWQDFANPNLVCKGSEHVFLRAVTEYEEHTHPEPTRTGTTERPNTLELVIFVSTLDLITLIEKLKGMMIEIEEQVSTARGRVVIC